MPKLIKLDSFNTTIVSDSKQDATDTMWITLKLTKEEGSR